MKKKDTQEKLIDKLLEAFDIIKLVLALGIAVAACIIFDDIYVELIASFAGFLVAMVFGEIILKIKRRLEDKNKVATDDFRYDKKTYLYDVHVGDKTTYIWYFPLINDVNAHYEVIDSPKKYFALEDLLKVNFTLIMQAHQTSYFDNPTMIRLDDCREENGTVKLYTSRTSYYNDLVTNRSMDYKFSGDLTVRKIYEGGKYLSPLNESLMSNHIGLIAHVFHGKNTILAQRGGNATISKNKFTTCIATGLSQDDILAVHGVMERHPIVTTKDLLDGVILLKLADRLNLSHERVLALFDEGKIKVHLFGLGQLVYTGGKPQFYYAVTVDESVDLSEINARPVNKNQIDYNKCMVTASRFSLKSGHTLKLECVGRRNMRGEAERSFYIGLWHIQTQPKVDGIPDWMYEN